MSSFIPRESSLGTVSSSVAAHLVGINFPPAISLAPSNPMLVTAFNNSSESSVWESDWESDNEADSGEEKKKRRRKIKKRKAGESLFWENCHLCRREMVRIDYVKCSKCPLRFCGVCLLRKHGEDVLEEMQENVRWVCPICRGGCGPGCRMNCCGCGPCRKYQQLEPAGRVLNSALKAGFSNVHDYLVHFETGEPPQVISKRKEGRGWTKATGAIDDSVMMGKGDLNLTWAMKKMRSTRGRVVARMNSKWGHQNAERCQSEVQEPVARMKSNGRNQNPQNSSQSEDQEELVPTPEKREISKRIRRPSSLLESFLY